MKIDINEFKARLEKEIANGNPEIAEFIHNEIRLAETMKASLMEEMNNKTADFLKDISVRFDTYLFQLQEIEKEMQLRNLSLDQETALNDEKMRENIAKEMNELNKIVPVKYPEADDTQKVQKD